MSYFSIGVFESDDPNEAHSVRKVFCVQLFGRVYEVYQISSTSIPIEEWIAKFG